MNYNDFFYDFGYEYFGPFLLSYVKWIENNLIKNNIKKCYFLSRDGFLMKDAFDIINNSDEISSFYFYASRRSITVPSFCDENNIDDILKDITLPEKIKMSSLIKKLGLEDMDLKNYIEKHNICLSNIYSLKKLDNNVVDFLNDILHLIISNSREEKKFLIKYAKKNNFNGKVAIVDIGWYGSMQNALNKIFPDVDIYGYYAGLVPNGTYCKSKLSNKYYGFISDDKHGAKNFEKLHNNINIFEFLFLAQHGSVKKFKKDGVEFYDYEYDNKVEREIVRVIQNGALDYVRDNKDNDNDLKDSIDKLLNYFLHPSLKTATLFGDLQFMDKEFRYIAKPKKVRYYLLKPKEFKKDYIGSSWRIGFLKRIYKIKLPYYFINKSIRKIFKREW